MQLMGISVLGILDLLKLLLVLMVFCWQGKMVIVGIVNHEYDVVDYSLELVLDNELLAQYQETISLSHNETWERNVTFSPDRSGEDMKLQFLLYKDYNYTAPYRDLHLWINVSEKSLNRYRSVIDLFFVSKEQ